MQRTWLGEYLEEYTQNQYLLSVLVYVHEVYMDRMRSSYYPGVCTKPGTYYHGWFMYMRYTQGLREEHLQSRSMY